MDASTTWKIQVLRYITVSVTVVAFWEHLIWLNSEFIIWKDLYTFLLRLLQTKDDPKPLGKRSNSEKDPSSSSPSYIITNSNNPPFGRFLVLAVRYTLLTCCVLSFIFYLGRPHNCAGIFTGLWSMFALCWALSAMIFLVRVYIIWGQDRRVLVFFSLLLTAALAGWIYDVTQYKVVRVEAILSPQPWCTPAPDSKFRAFCWGLCLLFDTCVLIATLIKLRQRKSLTSFGQAAITKRYLLKTSLVYFAVAFAVNLACFVVELTVSDVVLSHIPSPIAFALNPIVAIRSVLVADQYFRDEAAQAVRAQAQANLSNQTDIGASPIKTLPRKPIPTREVSQVPSRGVKIDHTTERVTSYPSMTMAPSTSHGTSIDGKEGYDLESMASSSPSNRQSVLRSSTSPSTSSHIDQSGLDLDFRQYNVANRF